MVTLMKAKGKAQNVAASLSSLGCLVKQRGVGVKLGIVTLGRTRRKWRRIGAYRAALDINSAHL